MVIRGVKEQRLAVMLLMEEVVAAEARPAELEVEEMEWVKAQKGVAGGTALDGVGKVKGRDARGDGARKRSRNSSASGQTFLPFV